MLQLTRPELRLALLAAAVRLALLLGATGGDLLLPDYDTSKTLAAELARSTQPPALQRSYAASTLRGPQPGTSQPQAGAVAADRALLPTPDATAAPWPLRGWLVWDAVFFANIASRGYIYEQYYAFFPLMPALLSHAPPELFALLAVSLNAAASVVGVVLLYRLGVSLTRNEELAATACLFFILSPAAIFHAAPYTEAAFIAATLAVLCCLHCGGRGGGGGSSSSSSSSTGAEGADNGGGDSGGGRQGGPGSGGPAFSLVRLLAATAAVAVSCGLRSNGIVNAGYVGHYSLQHAVAVWPKSKARALRTALLGVVAAAVSIAPLVLFQAAAYATFCRRDVDGAGPAAPAAPAGADDLDESSSGISSSSSSSTGGTGGGRGGTGPYDWPRPWCSSRLPYVYGFVQSLYWNVGFLRYWTLQQAPNFLLAMPVLLLSAAGLFEFGRANARHMAGLGLLPPPKPPHDAAALAAAEEEDAAAKVQELPKWRPESSPIEREAQVAALTGQAGEHRTGELRRRRGSGGTSDGGGKVSAAAAPSLRRGGTPGAHIRSGSRSAGFLAPELAVTMFPWAFSLLVAVTAMHVQVSTRFLLSSCPPLYWYMAHLWRRGTGRRPGKTAVLQAAKQEPWCATTGAAPADGFGSGAAALSSAGGEGGESSGWDSWVAVSLWRWCFVYMALGGVLFVNFLPWT
ncbi:hypothetical protein HXX76_003861 [Chlamydomonas incerta]|uniref:GPI mannosyltransferase 2 n=1 Tax=Chlamydomonas incerta TaxID=51695 RepID=A0A835T995_CHLIN|nr:hypothetical protein HXX76_003861 [Chlamydomonas incerta]|eukprot:KAG2441008.1 hypothetical protein HXX76_003861 [Chlamydomonas incerta]